MTNHERSELSQRGDVGGPGASCPERGLEPPPVARHVGPERGEDSGQLIQRLLSEADIYERLGIIEDLPSLLREAASALTLLGR